MPRPRSSQRSELLLTILLAAGACRAEAGARSAAGAASLGAGVSDSAAMSCCDVAVSAKTLTAKSRLRFIVRPPGLRVVPTSAANDN
jgi:hypothetical protein